VPAEYLLTAHLRDKVIGDLLESLGILPFISELDWTAAQFDSLMEEVRTELANLDLKLYINM
jgi:hypothetical protein